MIIGIDCRTITGTAAGVGHYTHHLVAQLVTLYPDDQFILAVATGEPVPTEFIRDNVTIVPFSASTGINRLWKSARSQAAQLITDYQCDVFHGPAYMLPRTTIPTIATVHDLAIYDHPEWFPQGQWLATRWLVPRVITKASRIIAVSTSTANDVERLFSVPAEQIDIVYEGVAALPQPDASVFAEQGIGDKTIVHIGTLEPRKNLVRLIAAFDALLTKHAELSDYQLVFVGATGWQTAPIDAAIAEARFGAQIVRTGYVSSAEKAAIIAAAGCVAYPSLWEGFGLPLLEAQQQGVPVVTSQLSAIPEVAGDAAVYCDPYDVESITLALHTALTDQATRAQLADAGPLNAARFSWQKTAKDTYKTYETAVAQAAKV